MARLPNVRRRHHVHPFKDYCGVCWMSPVEPGSSCPGSRQGRADPRGPGEKAYDAARAAELPYRDAEHARYCAKQARSQASDLLRHYIQLACNGTGIPWSPDNTAEILCCVEQLIEAGRAAAYADIIDRFIDHESRIQELEDKFVP